MTGDNKQDTKSKLNQGENVSDVIHSQDEDTLKVAAAEGLTEDLALAMLERRDLSPLVLEALASNHSVAKLRRVLIAIMSHPATPRRISLPLTRRLYTFELMRPLMRPGVPADVKLAIEKTIVNRLETVTAGERLTLAKQGSTRIAAALLLDSDPRVMHAALENPRLTEVCVVRAALRADAPAALINAVCGHARWSLKREVQIALLRNEHTPFARALQFARQMPRPQLAELLRGQQVPSRIKSYLQRELQQQKGN